MERHIAIYIRVSSQDQAHNKEGSLTSQEQRCREYLAYKYKGQASILYKDEGLSAKDTNRPAYQQLIYAIQAGMVQAVCCTELSRVSRTEYPQIQATGYTPRGDLGPRQSGGPISIGEQQPALEILNRRQPRGHRSHAPGRSTGTTKDTRRSIGCRAGELCRVQLLFSALYRRADGDRADLQAYRDTVALPLWHSATGCTWHPVHGAPV